MLDKVNFRFNSILNGALSIIKWICTWLNWDIVTGMLLQSPVKLCYIDVAHKVNDSRQCLMIRTEICYVLTYTYPFVCVCFPVMSENPSSGPGSSLSFRSGCRMLLNLVRERDSFVSSPEKMLSPITDLANNFSNLSAFAGG